MIWTKPILFLQIVFFFISNLKYNQNYRCTKLFVYYNLAGTALIKLTEILCIFFYDDRIFKDINDSGTKILDV